MRDLAVDRPDDRLVVSAEIDRGGIVGLLVLHEERAAGATRARRQGGGEIGAERLSLIDLAAYLLEREGRHGLRERGRVKLAAIPGIHDVRGISGQDLRRVGSKKLI